MLFEILQNFNNLSNCLQEKPASSRRQQHKPFTSTQEISESDDSMDDLDDEDINDPSGYADRHGKFSPGLEGGGSYATIL